MSAQTSQSTTEHSRREQRARRSGRAMSAPLDRRIERVRQAAERLGASRTDFASRVRPHVPKTP
jgi:hypothetical protein